MVTISEAKAGIWPAGAWTIALVAAAFGWLATGLLVAVPAGAGLGVLAASDLKTHRISLRVLGTVSALVALALVADAAVDHSWGRLALTVAGTGAVAALLVLAWLWSAGISFGDVLLGALAVVVPLHLSLAAAAVTPLAALVAAACYVVARAARSGAGRSTTVPMAPALLVGWLCGVVVS